MPQQLSEEELKNMSPEQIAELQKQNCPFCLINKGQIPAKKVYEDDKCLAILDINPATSGHIILYPKEHVFLMPQMDGELISHLAIIAKKLSNSILKAFKEKGVEGTNIFIANGAVAGQKAPHVLVHIVPRSSDDGLTNFKIPKKTMSEKDLKAMQKIISEAAGHSKKEDAAEEKKEEDTKEVEETEGKQEEEPQPESKEKSSLDTISQLLSSGESKEGDQEGNSEENDEDSDIDDESEEEKDNQEEKEDEDESKEKDSGINLDSIANVLGK